MRPRPAGGSSRPLTRRPITWPDAAYLEGALVPGQGHSFCEWKGEASYLDVVGGPKIAAGPVALPEPQAALRGDRGHVALYPGLMTNAWSTVNGSNPSQVASTAAGSLPTSSDRSRGPRQQRLVMRGGLHRAGPQDVEQIPPGQVAIYGESRSRSDAADRGRSAG